MAEFRFARGEVIFRPGDPGEHAFVIHSGTVEILTGPPDKPIPLALLGPGEVFGEMSLVEHRPRSLAARAATDCVAAALDRDEFHHRICHDQALCLAYVRSLFKRLRATTARLTEALADDDPAPPPPPATPTATRLVLLPLTRQAAQTLPRDGLPVERFPFRVGRTTHAHETAPADGNDLSLPDAAP